MTRLPSLAVTLIGFGFTAMGLFLLFNAETDDDLLMAGVDGFEAAAELCRRPETAAIPILVFTSKELSAEDRRRLAGRVAGLLSKAPEDRRRLVDKIRELEQRRHAGAHRP